MITVFNCKLLTTNILQSLTTQCYGGLVVADLTIHHYKAQPAFHPKPSLLLIDLLQWGIWEPLLHAQVIWCLHQKQGTQTHKHKYHPLVYLIYLLWSASYSWELVISFFFTPDLPTVVSWEGGGELDFALLYNSPCQLFLSLTPSPIQKGKSNAQETTLLSKKRIVDSDHLSCPLDLPHTVWNVNHTAGQMFPYCRHYIIHA